MCRLPRLTEAFPLAGCFCRNPTRNLAASGRRHGEGDIRNGAGIRFAEEFAPDAREASGIQQLIAQGLPGLVDEVGVIFRSAMPEREKRSDVLKRGVSCQASAAARATKPSGSLDRGQHQFILRLRQGWALDQNPDGMSAQEAVTVSRRGGEFLAPENTETLQDPERSKLLGAHWLVLTRAKPHEPRRSHPDRLCRPDSSGPRAYGQNWGRSTG